MSKITDGLKEAFAGESQANRKYLAFAKKAEEEGHAYAAKLFRAAAHAETVHAMNHWRALGGVQSTTENLQAAIEGESYEVTSMYPPFIAAAEEEGDKKALNSFKWAWEVEKVHEGFFRQALAGLGQAVEDGEFYVCPVCGHTHYGKSAPEKCPVCGAPGSKYEVVK
jgi:rubrerythrin